MVDKGMKLFHSITVLLLLTLLAGAVQAVPSIQRWETSNGARVLYVHAPELPMVDVRIIFDAGSARDGDIPGIALMTNSLLTEGAGKWDADQIAERLENVGADLSADSLRDMGLLALRTLTEEEALSVAVDTMATVIAQPTFEQQAINRNLQALKIVLRQELQSPGKVASKAFYKAMYDSHPYAHPSTGTTESLEKITRQAIEQFHKKYYVARNAVVTMVGAVDKEQAKALAEKLVGQLPAGEHAPALPDVQVANIDLRNEIDFPSQQAHLYIGMPVLSRNDPDYFPLYVGNHVLGGSGLVSRLSVEVREKRGLAYSSYSYFSPMRGAGPFMVGLQTKNSQAKLAEEVVRDTLQAFIEQGPTRQELQRSKQNITGGFPLRISSNKKIIEYLGMLGFYNLPLDYLETYVAKVNAVTAKQIQDAFKRRVNLQQLATVVVGNLDEN